MGLTIFYFRQQTFPLSSNIIREVNETETKEKIKQAYKKGNAERRQTEDRRINQEDKEEYKEWDVICEQFLIPKDILEEIEMIQHLFFKELHAIEVLIQVQVIQDFTWQANSFQLMQLKFQRKQQNSIQGQKEKLLGYQSFLSIYFSMSI